MSPSTKPKLVVLSGAGISAESGIATFRDAGGLWEGYKIEDVATPEAWRKDPKLVLDFYNMRRKQALGAEPNAGHLALKELEKTHEVVIITQNVDNLHEKAGSSHVVHLHGELFKSRSTVDASLVYDISGWELAWGDRCAKGSQLRPHIVWFGEMVPMMETAIALLRGVDIFVVVGTSMAVYPAASLIDYVPMEVPKYVIDPKIPSLSSLPNLHPWPMKASEGLPRLVEELTKTSV